MLTAQEANDFIASHCPDLKVKDVPNIVIPTDEEVADLWPLLNAPWWMEPRDIAGVYCRLSPDSIFIMPHLAPNVWRDSTIIHEAVHFHQDRAGYLDVLTRKDTEAQAYRTQLAFLRSQPLAVMAHCNETRFLNPYVVQSVTDDLKLSEDCRNFLTTIDPYNTEQFA